MPNRNTAAFPKGLEFLETYVSSRRKPLRAAPWLHSSYDDPVWITNSSHVLTFDWSIPLGTAGDLLTNERHQQLWTVFRSWLLLQTDLAHNSGRILSPISIYNRLRHTGVWIDYFLLHADRLSLPEHGLMALSENDFKAALAIVGSRACVLDSIYDWPNRLTRFLRGKIEHFSNEDLRSTLAAQPLLELPSDVDCPVTQLDACEIVKARAWLWANGYYGASSSSEYRYAVRKERLVREAVPAITRAWGRFRAPVELALGPDHYCLRERSRAPVVSSLADRMSVKRYEMYRGVLHSLGALQSRGCAVPKVCGTQVDVHPDSLKLKDNGRYRSLPFEIVLYGLRRAIEFALEHGDHLVTSFLSVAKLAANEGTSVAVLDQRHSIGHWLDPATVRMGVKSWSIEPTSAGAGVITNAPKVLSRTEYYTALRHNEGLYECLRVLYGAIQMTIGLLVARRQGELIDLRAGTCLDKSRTRLVFHNRKSGVIGIRAVETRPIPPLGVRLIGMLERLNEGMVNAGLIEKEGPIFAMPAWTGSSLMTSSSTYTFNAALDMFCDYVEIPCNADGERYYIRQHQLRRFFAMTFFWCSGLDHLDTLRWFLGHTDLAHVYNYITAQTPGDVLRGVKAEWAAEAASRHAPETASLVTFLLASYGTEQFLLLDQEALTSHIDDLLSEGKVNIEPEFLDGGREYRILVKVTAIEERT